MLHWQTAEQRWVVRMEEELDGFNAADGGFVHIYADVPHPDVARGSWIEKLTFQEQEGENPIEALVRKKKLEELPEEDKWVPQQGITCIIPPEAPKKLYVA